MKTGSSLQAAGVGCALRSPALGRPRQGERGLQKCSESLKEDLGVYILFSGIIA